MKKLLFIVIGLLLFTQTSYAGLIQISVLSEDSEVNIAYLNNSFNIVKNVINGGLDDANIEDDSLTEAEFADDINPRVRWDEAFNNFTVTGHLPATSTAPDLFSDISAGTSYVDGFRTDTTATAHTYTASKDTWVYIDINSTFQFEVVANDAAEPSAPANSLKLARVVTDADNITSVDDERVTAIVIGSNEDSLLRGLRIHADNTAKISIDSGVVYHGETRIAKTAFTDMTVATAGDWHDGVVDTGAAVFYYIGVNPSGGIKFLGNHPPDTHDTSGNTDTPYYYWDDGSTKWRVIGQVKVDTSNNIQPHEQRGRKYEWTTPRQLTTTKSLNDWSAAVSCSDGIPATSTRGLFGCRVNTDGSSAEAGIMIRPNGGSWAIDGGNGIWFNNLPVTSALGGEVDRATDDSQQIQHYTKSSGDVTSMEIDIHGYWDNLRD